jgi:hypothetical protein
LGYISNCTGNELLAPRFSFIITYYYSHGVLKPVH